MYDVTLMTRDRARDRSDLKSVRNGRVDVGPVDPRLPHGRRGNVWRTAIQRPSINGKKESSTHRRTCPVTAPVNPYSHLPVSHLSRE